MKKKLSKDEAQRIVDRLHEVGVDPNDMPLLIEFLDGKFVLVVNDKPRTKRHPRVLFAPVRNGVYTLNHLRKDLFG